MTAATVDPHRGEWPGKDTISQALSRRVTSVMLASIRDYVNIHGEWMTVADAARRLGVSTRTVERYRAILLAARQIAAGNNPQGGTPS